LLTWGGWVRHHPPALFPPRVSQSRIQHHGQLPGAQAILGLLSSGDRGLDLLVFPRRDSMILPIPVLGSPCQCLALMCAQAPVLRPLA
ncbi:hypothetical protein GH733_010401, partial [Mirounga leonina]